MTVPWFRWFRWFPCFPLFSVPLELVLMEIVDIVHGAVSSLTAENPVFRSHFTHFTRLRMKRSMMVRRSCCCVPVVVAVKGV